MWDYPQKAFPMLLCVCVCVSSSSSPSWSSGFILLCDVQPGRGNSREGVWSFLSAPVCPAIWKAFHTKTFFLTPKRSVIQHMAHAWYFVGLALYKPVVMPITSDSPPTGRGEMAELGETDCWMKLFPSCPDVASQSVVLLLFGMWHDWQHFFLYSDRTRTYSKATSYLPFTPLIRACGFCLGTLTNSSFDAQQQYNSHC